MSKEKDSEPEEPPAPHRPVQAPQGPARLRRTRSLLASPRRRYRHVYGAVAAGLATVLLVLLVLQGLEPFTRVELAAYDLELAQRTNVPKVQNIVFVGVDQSSIADVGGGSYPIPRRWMARAVTFLHRAGARVIAIDFLYERTTRDDAALARAIKSAGNVVQADELAAPSSSNYVGPELQLVPPVDPIGQVTNRLGVANVQADVDRIIRSADLEQVGPGGSGFAEKYPSFATQVAAAALHQPVSNVLHGLSDHILINYVGSQVPGGGSQALLTYQFTGVARGEDDPAVFRNKIVVLGCAAVICNDIKGTPLGEMYGGILEANVVNTILNRNPITPVGNDANNLVVVIVGLATVVSTVRFGIWRSIVSTMLLGGAYPALAFLLFDRFRLWVHMAAPEVTIVLAFAAVMALRFATEERERRRTRRLFGQYVTPEIVDLLMEAPDEETALAGARRPITVLFVDIRGFTRMSEVLEPEEVVAALEIYREELTASVQAYDGTLAEYVGDECMAIWNAPGYQNEHAFLGVLCALDMLSRMDRINKQLQARDLPPLRYGIGVNTGDAVVGSMGSSFRRQYGVIGDSINTGARLCSAAGGGEIIMGERTAELVGRRIVSEETPSLPLKGKQQPLRTFRVLGVGSEPALEKPPVYSPA